MRNCDVLILPSIEEGSALVTYDARAAGCLLLVSDASGAICEHEENALVHPAGDAAALAEHISRVDGDRTLLNRLTSRSLQSIDEITWEAAGIRMVKAYERMVSQHKPLMASYQRN
jgi:glycosyltransferase involved in cell wall biosynthesis